MAANFAENGVVIAFGKFDAPVPCFDAEWLSCHQHEREVLFFGGDSILQIRGILKIERGRWVSYTKQLEAIQAIRSLANGSLIADGISRRTKNEIYRMIHAILNHNLVDTIQSPYVRELLLYQINNTPTKMTFDWDIISTEWRFLGEDLLWDQQNRIPHILDMINLFPQSQCIVFLMPDMFAMRTFHWNSVMEDLADNHRAMTLVFQWQSDVGDVFEESFASLHRADRTRVQTTNLRVSREPLSIKLVITEVIPSSLSMTSEVVQRDGTKLHYDTSIFGYRPLSPRSHPSRKYPMICLDLCQYDWVTPLTIEERIESLVYGYVRELCPAALVAAIGSACFKYTGDATLFVDDQALVSLTESGLNCCGPATKWGQRGRVMFIPVITLIKFIVDILSLVTACTHDVGITTVYLAPLDVTSWLFVASIADLMMICNSCSLICGSFVDLEKFVKIDTSLRDRMFGTVFWLELLLTVFYFIWIVIGMLLVQQVGTTHLATDVMLTWCIIQAITSVLVPVYSRVAEVRKDSKICVETLCCLTCWNWCFEDLPLCSGDYGFLEGLLRSCIAVCPLLLRLGGLLGDIVVLAVVSETHKYADYDCQTSYYLVTHGRKNPKWNPKDVWCACFRLLLNSVLNSLNS